MGIPFDKSVTVPTNEAMKTWSLDLENISDDDR